MHFKITGIDSYSIIPLILCSLASSGYEAKLAKISKVNLTNSLILIFWFMNSEADFTNPSLMIMVAFSKKRAIFPIALKHYFKVPMLSLEKSLA
jgi:hypothetical protein